MSIIEPLKMGHEQLMRPSAPVENIKSPEVQCIIEDLIDSMRHYDGIGIAAPQVGYFQRIFILEFDSPARYPDAESLPLTIMINPEIKILTDKQEEDWEGCLSVPGYRGLVPRATHIGYRAYDRNGDLFEGEATGFLARAIQHEYDHLDGILFPMRIENLINFVAEDVFWERLTGKPYPEELKKKVRERW